MNFPAPQAQSKHIPELDGLRAFAILPVLLTHVVYQHPFLAKVPLYGWAGVDLFFVLSGFLITRILLQERGKKNYFRDFYGRRALRIWPIYYLLLFLVYVPGRHWGPLFVFPHSIYPWTTFAAYLQNLLISDLGPFPLQMTWSLAIEEQFYFVWPMAVAKLPQTRLRRLCAALFLITPLVRMVSVALGNDFHMMWKTTWFRMDGLALGSFVAVVAAEGGPDEASWTRRMRWLAPAGAVAWILLTRLPSRLSWLDFCWVPWVVALAGTGLLCVALHSVGKPGISGWILRLPVLRGTGKISYGLYIYHLLIYALIWRTGLYHRIMRGPHPLLNDLLGVALLLACSFAVAFASWRLIETPLLRLKRYFHASAASESAESASA